MPKTKRYYWLGHHHDQPSDQDRFFLEALDKDLWESGNKEQWDTCWYSGMPDQDIFDTLDSSKTINHIPGNNALTIKSNLYNTLADARHRLAGTKAAKRFNFFPETFCMPSDYLSFLEAAREEPEQLWIKKPKNLSRGRGIDMVRHPATVPFDGEWILQRYLCNPHLCQGRKYVLRCYVLITSVEPLRVYWYQDGFAKLASEAYSRDDLHNLYRHLTNPDINEKNENAKIAVTFISFNKYRAWLRNEGHDEQAFFKQLKELITLTVISAREAMRSRCNTIEGNTSGCYELIGLDCMVDDQIKPWIIECNLSPSLSTYSNPDAGADDEISAKRNMVRDMVNLLGLNTLDEGNSSDPQQLAQQEYERRGKFELLFPATDANDYFNTFPIPRYADIVQAKKLSHVTIDEKRLELQPNAHSDFVFDDSVALFSHDRRMHTQCLTPNELASWIWLNHSDTISPTSIIEQLQHTLPQASKNSSDTITPLATQVWDMLADWSHANLFTQEISETPTIKPLETPITFFLPLADYSLSIHCFCQNAAHYLKEAGKTLLKQTSSDNLLITIDIIPSQQGYSLIHQRNQAISSLRLSQLLPILCQSGMETLAEKKQALLLPGCLLSDGEQNILLICEEANILDSVSYQFSEQTTWQVQGHYVLLSNNRLTGVKLPARLTELPQTTHLWAIAETKHQTTFCYQPWPNNHTTLSNINIDQVIIISHDVNIEDTKINHQRSEALKQLWKHLHHTDIHSSIKLTQWIDTIGRTSVLYTCEKTSTKTLVKKCMTLLQSISTENLSIEAL